MEPLHTVVRLIYSLMKDTWPLSAFLTVLIIIFPRTVVQRAQDGSQWAQLIKITSIAPNSSGAIGLLYYSQTNNRIHLDNNNSPTSFCCFDDGTP